MKLYRTSHGILLENINQYFCLHHTEWDVVVNRDDLHAWLLAQTQSLMPLPLTDGAPLPEVLPPIGTQELWAPGVTYLRSREARVEESTKAGGGSFYDRVYDAEAPRTFF